ncbi:MAG: transglutaminase domain-containing protein, partial [Lentisphaeria bacterium]|nr:transglutaminase domain-containing protein [Lentisphaeria bacterium]
KPGSTVEYTVEKIWRDHPLFAWKTVMPECNPVLKKDVTIRLADDFRGVRLDQSGIAPGESTQKVRNLEPIPEEPGRPDGWYFAPHQGIAAGSRSAMAAELLRWLMKRSEEQSHAIAKARSLCAGLSGETEKIVAIKEFVETAIRSTAPGYPELPLSALSAADRTLQDGYGNSADRAILYKAMLDAVGVPCRFVALHNKEASPEVIADAAALTDPGDFPEIAVAAGTEIIPVYLNAGDRYTSPGSSNAERRLGWDLAEDRLRKIEVREPSMRNDVFEIRIAPDGSADVQWTLVLRGMDAGRMKRFLTELTPEELRRESQKLAAALSQNARLHGDLQMDWNKSPAEVRLSMTIPDFVPERNGYRQLTLPRWEALTAPLTTAGHVRKTPLERIQSRETALHYNIIYPAAWTLLPERDFSGGDDFSRVSVKYSAATDGKGNNRLQIDAKEELAAGILPPEDYGKLIRLQRQLSDPSMPLILLKSQK